MRAFVFFEVIARYAVALAMFLRSVARRAALLAAASAFSALAIFVACSSSDGGATGTMNGTDTGTSSDGPRGADGNELDGGSDSAPTGKCAEKFGAALTEGFGRIDGTVYAVQKPTDTTCAMPEKDRVVVQVLMNGAVYRMVIEVTDPGAPSMKLHVSSFPHVMPQPEYEEGWRTGVPMDYANILGAHSIDGGFAPLSSDEVIAKIVAELKVGDPVSVYAVSSPGNPQGAELVHRNKPARINEDGAIVVGPTSAAPKFLLFHFDYQTF